MNAENSCFLLAEEANGDLVGSIYLQWSTEPEPLDQGKIQVRSFSILVSSSVYYIAYSL